VANPNIESLDTVINNDKTQAASKPRRNSIFTSLQIPKMAESIPLNVARRNSPDWKTEKDQGNRAMLQVDWNHLFPPPRKEFHSDCVMFRGTYVSLLVEFEIESFPQSSFQVSFLG